MPVYRGNIVEVINQAWKCAIRTPENLTNRERSRNWVCELAKKFQSKYHDEKIHRVFWQGNKDNREQFAINEFLFDVMVCSVSQVESLQRRSNPLDFIDQWSLAGRVRMQPRKFPGRRRGYEQAGRRFGGKQTVHCLAPLVTGTGIC